MNKVFWSLFFISGGSIFGAGLRYLTALAAQRYSITFPFGTLAVNWAGCFFIGCVTTLISEAGVLTSEQRLFLITGFCGSFTTLSSMVYESAQLVKAHEFWFAGVYWGATCVGAFGWFYLGVFMIKLLLHR